MIKFLENHTVLAEQKIEQLFACTGLQMLSPPHFHKNRLIFRSKQGPSRYFVQTRIIQQFPV